MIQANHKSEVNANEIDGKYIILDVFIYLSYDLTKQRLVCLCFHIISKK